MTSGGTTVVTWFTSSHSGGEGNECVEIASMRTRCGLTMRRLSLWRLLSRP
ncbi:DUF397 domain-containing protein [Streptomyces coeruleorubidus]|uniref:DUF397 domain-containing protein n=1 Tax=Streptomyces coeruleorubidus TaxID=116188 RepID=UPI0037029E21